MLIVDELKQNDPPLRLVAMVLAAGLCILLAGLWWVQVVSAREYQNHLEMQAYRTIRVPAMRGKILDREGRVLAENRPRYNLSLYFDDLNDEFTKDQVRAVLEILEPCEDDRNQPRAPEAKGHGRPDVAGALRCREPDRGASGRKTGAAAVARRQEIRAQL